jgi:hypothetical protein
MCYIHNNPESIRVFLYFWDCFFYNNNSVKLYF